MTPSVIRIVTRESPLAMWQAQFVRQALFTLHPEISVEILGITTEADRLLESSLESLGGKGAFVKELEQALLNNRADIAVHSMKDVSVNLPPELDVPVVLEREDARDVMISREYGGLMDLPEAARVGTSSLRRKCQLLSLRPDLTILDIRGNVGTRLRKLDDGKYDALVLAAAGIKRLGLEDRISQYIETQSLLPAVSQGALGIEIRRDDTAILELIEPLRHEASYLSVLAERALNRHLGGDCHVPIAAHAQVQGEQITMHALVGRLDGSLLIRSSGTAPVQQAELLGSRLGQELLDQGAGTILQELNQKHEG